MTSTSRDERRGEVTSTMRAQDGAGVVRTESRFATTVEDLWEALTTPERLARWIGEVAGDLRPGGTFSATFTSSWSGTGVVEVCEPHRRLVTRMGEDEDGETVMEATLEEQGDGVLLVIEERGLPLTNLSAYGAGWQVHVEDLGHHLDGTERTDWLDRWRELVPAYREQQVG